MKNNRKNLTLALSTWIVFSMAVSCKTNKNQDNPPNRLIQEISDNKESSNYLMTLVSTKNLDDKNLNV